MVLRRIWHPRTLLALGALAATVALLACGGTTTAPQDTGGSGPTTAAQSAAPTLDPFAGVQEPTPTTRLDATATPVPVPTAVPVDERPDWWQDGEDKHYRGDFPLVATSNPGFWDVHYGGSMNTVLIPSGPRFNQILEYNPVEPSEIIGDLAVSWESYTEPCSEGPTCNDGNEFGYIFHLNEDATFSDGHPVTAADVVFSINRITLGQVQDGVLRARTGFLNNFVVHDTASVVDDHTAKIPLRFPAAGFLPNLASDYMKVYPEHIAANLTQEQANQADSLIGSGPWKLREWEKDAGYAYDRNETYFKEGRPFFDGLRIYLIRDTARRIAALQNGQVYGTYQPVTGSNRPEDMARLEEDSDGQVRAVILEASGVQAFFLNITRPPFDDPRVRKAMYLGIDRQNAVDKAILGFGSVGTFFAPGVVEDLDDLKATNPAFMEDRSAAIAEAKELLADAGFPDGFEITHNVVSSNPSLSTAETVAPQLRADLGIDIVIQPADLATMYVGLRDGVANFDGVGTGIILRDPGDILNQFYLQDVLRNPHNWQNDEVDRLIDAQNEEVDPAARQALLEDLADILHEGESHWLPVLWYSSGGAFDYRIRNYYYPPTVQLIKKWDHVYWDPDRVQPEGVGYKP